MAVVNEVRRVDSGFANKIADAFQSLSVRIEQARVYRTTVSELSALADRELADLALHRSMIHAIAHEAAYGK